MGDVTPWQTERARLNHDVLKNQVLQAISYVIRVAEGRVRDDSDYQQAFLHGEVGRWPEIREQLEMLISRFETAMSPADLFSAGPLSRIEEEDRAWMAALIHHQWWTVSGMRDLVQQCEDRLSSADSAWTRVARMLGRPGAASATGEKPARAGARDDEGGLRKALVELYERCRELSDAISRLPSDVRLPSKQRHAA